MQYFEGPTRYDTYSVPDLDIDLLVQWRTSTLSLLSRVFSEASTTFKEFNRITTSSVDNLHSYFDNLRSIFQSAKSDYEGGYLFDVRNLLNAEVFSDELGQAKHFLNANYKVAAAVIAGTVLETSLRTLCEQHPTLSPSDKLNKMNDDLAKEGVYNALRKKQVTAWADIRNSAAHGKPDEFEPADVDRMIDGVRDFVAAQLT